VKPRKALQWVFVIAVFVFLGRILWENWTQVREAPFTFRIFPLVLSTLVFAFSYLIQFWAWYLITLRVGIAISFRETLGSWFYSQMGKYLPGKIWLLLSRFYIYGSKGKSKEAVTLALYFETVTIIVAAGLLFLASLPFLRGGRFTDLRGVFPWMLLALAFAFLFLHPRVLQKVLNRILNSFHRTPLFLTVSYSDILLVLGICVLSWVVGGIGFYLFVDSLFPISSKHFLFLTGALAISSTLGLVALFAPSGLGVREGVLVYLLSSMMPSSVAVILSVLTRLWMTFIEMGMIGMVYLVDQLRRK